MNIAQIAKNRHSCKAFDPTRSLSAEQLQQVQDLLYWAPSSINSQPWHFFLASTTQGKEKIAHGMVGDHYAYNAQKVRDAALTVVFCAKTDLPKSHLEAVLAQEAADGRFATAVAQAKRRAACYFFTDLHRSQGDVAEWLAHQSYLALGQLLLGTAAMGLDACPIEGFDPQVMDAALGLPALGLRSMVAAAVGWRSSADFNAALPKSRLPTEQVLTYL
jgi:nitroreductase/dihydropteridine reductase